MEKREFSKKAKIFFIGFGVATFIGLISTAIRVTTELAENYYDLKPEDFSKIIYPLVDELSASYSFLILIPFMNYLFKKFQLTKDTWIKYIPLYMLFSILIGLTHTGMMYSSRSIIYPAFGLGDYDYGYIPFRIVMEYLKQLGIFWVVFIVYSLFKTIKEKEAHRIKTAELEEQLTKARLETLKMQLNPHFLFNTLNMISSQMYEDIQAADKMIATLSDLLRITLKSSNKRLNTLEKEIEILNLYIDIMKARFKDKLDVTIKVEDDVVNALVPNFLFQPLVENSIKYGMENLTNTKIEIIAKKNKKNYLLITIKDNGPGINKDSKSVLKSGIGLSNTVERLEKLYGTDYEFNWENQIEGGLLLTIGIPYKEKEEEN